VWVWRRERKRNGTRDARGEREERTVGQELDDLLHLLLETDLENPIGLIDDQSLEVLEDESLGVLFEVKREERKKRTRVRSASTLSSSSSAPTFRPSFSLFNLDDETL